tara:strand:+ start:449 stop:598 length:150 start_codon:yes stop_codon:yes gene_type:complete
MVEPELPLLPPASPEPPVAASVLSTIVMEPGQPSTGERAFAVAINEARA